MSQKNIDNIVNTFIEMIENGVKPWKCPWSVGSVIPKNYATDKLYSGANIFILWMYANKFGYASNAWMTFKQASEAGYKVKKGSKSVPVIFYKSYEVEDDESEDGKKIVKFLKTFNVFNIEQFEDQDGNALPLPENLIVNPDIKDEQLIKDMEELKLAFSASTSVNFKTGGGQAYYSLTKDEIVMPDHTLFETADGYASTLLHEIGHSTGSNSRLGRFEYFESFLNEKDAYAIEELVAELFSTLVSVDFGVTGEMENHASYLNSWLTALKKDKTLFFKAAAKAQIAYEYFNDVMKDTKLNAA